MESISDAVTQIPEGIILKVMVTAGSKHPALFTSYTPWRKAFHCNLGAPAIEGRANRELIERCARFFRVAPAKIRIVEGQLSTTKKILLIGIIREDAIRLLEQNLLRSDI